MNNQEKAIANAVQGTPSAAREVKIDPRSPADFSPLTQGRHLLRTIRSGALATLDPAGIPLATLVSVATDADGVPLILVSKLSSHTRNLDADPRFSLLLATTGKGDPLAHPRLSLTGSAVRITHDRVRRRFLARHPKAALYADFADFGFFRLEPTAMHLNGGFARAYDGPAADILTSLAGAEELIALEPEAIAHLNEDHADAVQLYAALAGVPAARWRVSGVDPAGLDLLAGDATGRLAFPVSVVSGQQLRVTLKELADAARRLERGSSITQSD